MTEDLHDVCNCPTLPSVTGTLVLPEEAFDDEGTPREGRSGIPINKDVPRAWAAVLGPYAQQLEDELSGRHPTAEEREAAKPGEAAAGTEKSIQQDVGLSKGERGSEDHAQGQQESGQQEPSTNGPRGEAKAADSRAVPATARLLLAPSLYPRPRAEGRVSILSVDGGGVRGALPARILTRLEVILQEKSGDPAVRLADFFDLFAGTSAGGVLCSMLVLPNKQERPAFSALEVSTFFTEHARHIFYRRYAPKWFNTLRSIGRPKYKAQNFEKILEKVLHEASGGGRQLTLANALRPLVVTSFDVSKGLAHFFDREAAQRNSSDNFDIKDVCRATSAAPTLFPPALISSTDGSKRLVCVDGGVVANNPTINAIMHAISNPKIFPPRPGKERITMKDILVLSLGCGEDYSTFPYSRVRKWGLLQWAAPIMDMLIWGGGRTVHAQVSMLCAAEECLDNYTRIEVRALPKISTRMDNTSRRNMEVLARLADECLEARAQAAMTLRGEWEESDETNIERLAHLADQLIAEREYRIQAREEEALARLQGLQANVSPPGA